MDAHRFNEVIEEQLERSTTVLFLKNANYNPTADKLRGFKASAAMRETSAKDALAGMMLKHTLSIYDMCGTEETFSAEVWNEKITDHINYLLLLRAVVQEEEIDLRTSSDKDLQELRMKLTGEPQSMDVVSRFPDLSDDELMKLNNKAAEIKGV